MYFKTPDSERNFEIKRSYCVLHLSAGMKYDRMRSNKHWIIAEIKEEKLIKYNRLIQCNIWNKSRLSNNTK